MNVWEQPLSFPYWCGRGPLTGVSMNFRLVWMGPDDDSDANRSAAESADAVPHQRLGTTIYEVRGTEMVRRERLDNGRRKVTAIANFTARIVRDLVLDEDGELSREFGMEAQLCERPVAFVVSAAEFNRMGWVLNKLGPPSKPNIWVFSLRSAHLTVRNPLRVAAGPNSL